MCKVSILSIVWSSLLRTPWSTELTLHTILPPPLFSIRDLRRHPQKKRILLSRQHQTDGMAWDGSAPSTEEAKKKILLPLSFGGGAASARATTDVRFHRRRREIPLSPSPSKGAFTARDAVGGDLFLPLFLPPSPPPFSIFVTTTTDRPATPLPLPNGLSPAFPPTSDDHQKRLSSPPPPLPAFLPFLLLRHLPVFGSRAKLHQKGKEREGKEGHFLSPLSPPPIGAKAQRRNGETPSKGCKKVADLS